MNLQMEANEVERQKQDLPDKTLAVSLLPDGMLDDGCRCSTQIQCRCLAHRADPQFQPDVFRFAIVLNAQKKDMLFLLCFKRG